MLRMLDLLSRHPQHPHPFVMFFVLFQNGVFAKAATLPSYPRVPRTRSHPSLDTQSSSTMLAAHASCTLALPHVAQLLTPCFTRPLSDTGASRCLCSWLCVLLRHLLLGTLHDAPGRRLDSRQAGRAMEQRVPEDQLQVHGTHAQDDRPRLRGPG